MREIFFPILIMADDTTDLTGRYYYLKLVALDFHHLLMIHFNHLTRIVPTHLSFKIIAHHFSSPPLLATFHFKILIIGCKLVNAPWKWIQDTPVYICCTSLLLLGNFHSNDFHNFVSKLISSTSHILEYCFDPFLDHQYFERLIFAQSLLIGEDHVAELITKVWFKLPL